MLVSVKHIECDIYIAVANWMGEFITVFKEADPDSVQLMIRENDNDLFVVYCV